MATTLAACRRSLFLLAVCGAFSSLWMAHAQTTNRNVQRFNDGRNLCTQKRQRPNLCVTLPTMTTRNEIDIFFLLDGTDEFAGNITILHSAIGSLITELSNELGPDADIAYGVGQFQDFGGPPAETFVNNWSNNAKPFTLFQPIVNERQARGQAGQIQLIEAALATTNLPSPGDPDDPHTIVEALYEVATGLGFDGNNDNSFLGNRGSEQFAGRRSVRERPDSSGDVPSFSSLRARRFSGSIGGAGFRENALKLVVVGTPICSVSAFPGTQEIDVPLFVSSTDYNVNEFSFAFACANRDRFGLIGQVVPDTTTTSGAHGVQETIEQLNNQGIRVIGLYVDDVAGGTPNPPVITGSDDERVVLEALGRLTGTVDPTSGEPYMAAFSADPTTLKNNVKEAIKSAITIPAAGIELTSDDCDGLGNGLVQVDFPLPSFNVGVGEQVCFRPTFTLDSPDDLPQIFDSCTLSFQDVLLGIEYADIRVDFECSGTMQPSSKPSLQPSSQPSLQPSSFPSAAPSLAPSAQPSGIPSAGPSAGPSLQPSLRPSLAPSGQPSALPSLQPSTAPNLILSEVVDGAVDAGRPNYVEVTNCGDRVEDLSQYSLGFFNNGNPNNLPIATALRDGMSVMLPNTMLAPRESFVVRYARNGDLAVSDEFFITYGQAPDMTIPRVINGDDTIVLYEGLATQDGSDAPIVDIYGDPAFRGRDTDWDWRTGYAERLPDSPSNGGTFVIGHWSINPRALRGIGGNQDQIVADARQNLVDLTSPGTHMCSSNP